MPHQPNRKKQQSDWDQLGPKRKRVLYLANDPRVPIGWKPPGRQVSDWDDLKEKRKWDLYKMNDPRVPIGWQPPRKRRKLIPWDELHLKDQKKLFRENSPRVPPGWQPPPSTRDKSKPAVRGWHSLNAAEKVAAFWSNDPRVPLDWQPPVQKYSHFRTVKVREVKVARTIKRTDTEGEFGKPKSIPPELLGLTMPELLVALKSYIDIKDFV